MRACPGLPPELIKLLGRLKYRTSYGQNVLHHSIETSLLAAVIASEIGADVRPRRWAACSTTSARRSTTRSRARTPRSAPRSPRSYDLPFKVINGIAAHHQEVEYACLEAPIVQVADAISASRPGARGETMETYVKRLEDLQAIAESFAGRREVVRRPGRARGPDPRPARGDRRPVGDAPRARHRQEDRGAADLPGPDQGHGHPRDARRRVREVAAAVGRAGRRRRARGRSRRRAPARRTASAAASCGASSRPHGAPARSPTDDRCRRDSRGSSASSRRRAPSAPRSSATSRRTPTRAG